MQLNTSRLTRNAFGRARWDDTIGNYWTRADGRALSFQHELQNYGSPAYGRSRGARWRLVGLDVGEDSPSGTRHQHHASLVKSGHVRTSKVMSLPSDQGIKGKMATCFGPPKKNWHCTSVPITETMHATSGCPRSNLCCQNPLTPLKYSHDKKSEQGRTVQG